ncbi:hypothetical protein AcetOrient_orf03865 [Acetobacter orientalis]|uniref:Uncharacterized protein n=1 Tax=Acetobacter orientalis TaxID=146474 RepID=A0A2Z5ZJV4_9PROT|nr:hypothetical protein AcetOrient_orf03865 [Acetobacter orientalis]
MQRERAGHVPTTFTPTPPVYFGVGTLYNKTVLFCYFCILPYVGGKNFIDQSVF